MVIRKDLRRIEETLNQLTNKPVAIVAANAAPSQPNSHTPPPGSVSFEVHTKPPKVIEEEAVSVELEPPVKHVTSTEPKALNLPKLKTPSFSNLRHAANPSLAANLLREMLTTVEEWQTELNQVLRQIQDLYLEGPIVDGWLESYSGEPLTDTSQLRHLEVDRLMHYIEEICAAPVPGTKEGPRTGYLLCGLNSDGQRWSCPCPPDQVPSISLAIARYHKLRQLLNRKQDLEMRLSQLSETLVLMQGKMKE